MTRSSILSALLLICSSMAFAQTDAAYAKSPGFAAYRQAAGLFAAPQFPESLAELDRALTLDPKLVPALTLKAKLAMATNRYDVARECLERALAVDPSSSDAAFLYGFHYYQQNDMPHAVAALQKARQLNPGDPRTAHYLGLAEETLGQTAEAIAFYKDAIRLEEASGKPHVDPFLSYSRLLFILGDLDGCGQLIARALKLDPASRDAHFESGRLLLKKGQAGGCRHRRRSRTSPALRRRDGSPGPFPIGPGLSGQRARTGSGRARGRDSSHREAGAEIAV